MPSLPDETRIGAVELVVRDLDRSVSFYERAIGLEVTGRELDAEVRLGAGGEPLLVLRGEPEAPPRPPGTTGLFHFAILVPSRPELARSLDRLIEAGWRLTGASDHLVSEALYLDDPDGIGIEIYRDRRAGGVAARRRDDSDGDAPARPRRRDVRASEPRAPIASTSPRGSATCT